ncbi:MAG: hypothetical protein EOM28_11365 [Clostridia bacterium]|nr:hypothetical protein [Clostridia bacterium]
MQRFYNSLKHELFCLFIFDSPEKLILGICEFIYVKYNHVRSHSCNCGRTPHAVTAL